MRIRFMYAVAGLLMLFSAAADAGPIRLAFRNATVVGGTTFVVPVFVDSSLTGLNVLSYHLDISFNSTYLTYDTLIAAGSMTQFWSFEGNVVSPGRLLIAGSGSTVLSDTGRLVFIRFKANIPGSTVGTSLSFTGATTLFNQGNIPLSFANATITVQAPPFITVSPNTALITRGETQQFAVSGGKGPSTWVTTNTSVATISSTGLLTGVGPGLTKVIATDSVGVIDTSGNVEVRGLKLSVRDTSRYQGQTLDLPIFTTNVTGLGIISGQLTITYNQNLWTATQVIQSGTLIASASAPEFSVKPGQITISFAVTSPLSGSGILLYVRLQATNSTSGASSIGFQGILFNQDLLANTVSGNATVTPLPPLTVSPGGTQTLVKGDSLQFTVSGGTAPYTWSVSDPLRATVSPSGKVKVLRGGSITVKSVDNVGAQGVSGTVNLYDFRLTVPGVGVLVTTPNATIVEVPVIVSANDTGFFSFQLRLVYSTSYYLKLDSVITAGTFSSSWAVVPSLSGGSVQIAAAGTSPVFTGGSILRMRFVIPDSTPRPSTTTISLSNVLFNEGAPVPLVENGFVLIRTTNSKPTFSSRSPSTLTSVGVGVSTLFSVSASDPDGDPLTYTWKVNGLTEKSGSNASFGRTFSNPSAGTTVRAIFTDPFGLKDSTTWTFNVVTSVEKIGNLQPNAFHLEQNYPNPFNPSTIISYNLPRSGHVRLTIFNALGQLVEELFDEEQQLGRYQVEWRPQVPSGVYFYRLETGEFVATRKLLLLK